MKVWANFYVLNLRYHFKHKKISPNGTGTLIPVPKQKLSLNLRSPLSFYKFTRNGALNKYEDC